MKTKTILLVTLAIIGLSQMNAQVGIGTTSPDASAILDVDASPANDKGFLPPRLTTAQRNNLPSPAAGLVIYNVETKTLEFSDGTDWIDLRDSATITAINSSAATGGDNIGIGTTTPDASAVLDVDATDKGFLPPRLNREERNNISSPAEGLIIFNTDNGCLEFYNDLVWISACDGTGEGTIPGNTACPPEAIISATPCSTVPGATLNDDINTTEGTEYDWTGATGVMSGGTTNQALVEIGGQCWFKFNSIVEPTAPCADPINTGCNILVDVPSFTPVADNGYWGYYNTATPNGSAGFSASEPAVGEGLLYQWSAAMNGSTAERAQGVCPTGWHVPSDCEWMWLEGELGMPVTQQTSNSNIQRNTGSVGSDLASFTDNGNGTNISGFSALAAGRNNSFGSNFQVRGSQAVFWTSTPAPFGDAETRALEDDDTGVTRFAQRPGNSYSVRCIKD
jgi:uncharacterized protein (TIGR02145 family)